MTPRNILVPTDFSSGAERALDYACALSEKLGATIHLVNALGATQPELRTVLTTQMLGTLLDGSKAQLEKIAAGRAPIAKFGQIVVAPGDPRDVILETAAALHADLIIMGTHGRRGVSRMLLGSVADHVVSRAPCPVLTLREEKAP